MLACADIEEGIVLRRAGVRIPILVFGALGISDLDGVFEYDLTPTISTPAAAAEPRPPRPNRRPRSAGSDRRQTRVRLQAAELRPLETPLPPEDRHRHEPSRFPPRQPGADAAGDRKKRAPRDRRRLYPLRDRRRARAPGVRASSASGSSRCSRRCRRSGITPEVPPRREQRGAPARRARLVRLRPSRPAPLRHRPAAARRDCSRCDLPCHCTAVSCT